MALEVLPLLEADPTDFATVKQLVQTITAKKADLRLAQITERQGIRKLLTPAQQQQFRTMPSHMRGHAGMSSRDAKASITVHESRTCAYRNTPCCAPTRGEQCAKVVHAD